MSRKKSISLDLRWLEYFVAVADAGSILGAAFRLGITQPSVSQAMARLESQLDVALLIRDVRGAALTEAGAALAKHGREILKSIDVALEETRYLGGDARGQVAVGLSHGIGHLLSIALAETVSIKLPSVKLRISEGASGDVLEWLASGQVDFAVLHHGHACGDFEAQALFEENLFVVSAPDNWPPPGETIVPGQAIELKDLKGVPLVLPSPQHNLREFVERAARSSSIQLNIAVEMNSLRQIAALVSRGSAYTIMPHSALMDEISNGALVLVPIEPSMRRTAYLMRKRNRPVTRASSSVGKLVSVILKDMLERRGLRTKLVQ